MLNYTVIVTRTETTVVRQTIEVSAPNMAIAKSKACEVVIKNTPQEKIIGVAIKNNLV